MSDKEAHNRTNEKKQVKAFGLKSIVKTKTGITTHCTIFERVDEQPKPK